MHLAEIEYNFTADQSSEGNTQERPNLVSYK